MFNIDVHFSGMSFFRAYCMHCFNLKSIWTFFKKRVKQKPTHKSQNLTLNWNEYETMKVNLTQTLSATKKVEINTSWTWLATKKYSANRTGRVRVKLCDRPDAGLQCESVAIYLSNNFGHIFKARYYKLLKQVTPLSKLW